MTKLKLFDTFDKFKSILEENTSILHDMNVLFLYSHHPVGIDSGCENFKKKRHTEFFAFVNPIVVDQ